MGKLYVVATPIGNLSDISPRALETLQSVDLIAAEDTRVTGNLLRHFSIEKPLTSLHRHNEAAKAGSIIERMLGENISVALTTDAGTPAISDPGSTLVREAAKAGIEVLAIAGPSAMAAALSVSGFDSREFAFYGFMPREKSDLSWKLKKIAKGPQVAVLHESPHRIVRLMEVVTEVLPGCAACVCCDLTKLYEKTVRGSAEDVLRALHANPKVDKGEYCVILDFSGVELPEAAPLPTSVEAELVALMMDGMSMADAVQNAVSRGLRKNAVKRAAIRIRQWVRTFPLE